MTSLHRWNKRGINHKFQQELYFT